MGALLLFWAFGLRRPPIADAWFPPLWDLPLWLSWLATALVAAGFAFSWWARLTLGDLWSSTVTRKEQHEIVRRGPYGLVRHPIYTGLILSTLALAAQTGRLAGLIGAALLILGFWMKARLEERFLGASLGPDYDAYRRTTPMLTPFWPPGR
jgi:protein-S-isoprenylcysteine O-methyltransferase Ste14